VQEDRDASVWRHKFNDVLHFVAEQPVDTVDMFRLGRHDANKCRPILGKLRKVWDRRLILSKRHKLKDYSQNGIFIDSDEPIEVRRKQTLERMKRKAEREGKNVCVSDGVLSIDDVAMFSLTDDLLHNHNG
jgi:hypothetical protein